MIQKGQWDNEPDRVEWTYLNLKCLILRASEMRHLCGYVGLPKWHPCYGRLYNDIDIEVHGGLTFSEQGDGERQDKDLWWLGFDCAHAWDLVPGMRVDYLTTEKLAYRNIEYVKKETEHLAEQLTITEIAKRGFRGRDEH